jgi:hypothetical protein
MDYYPELPEEAAHRQKAYIQGSAGLLAVAKEVDRQLEHLWKTGVLPPADLANRLQAAIVAEDRRMRK